MNNLTITKLIRSKFWIYYAAFAFEYMGSQFQLETQVIFEYICVLA